MKRVDVTYAELAKRLKARGLEETELEGMRQKIFRGIASRPSSPVHLKV
jgi:hypothetical protein